MLSVVVYLSLTNSNFSTAKNPFDQMKVGAKIKRKQIDYADAKNEIWLEWQAPNNGPTFYAKDGAEGGQWKKPKIFEILDSVQTKESPKGKKITYTLVLSVLSFVINFSKR